MKGQTEGKLGLQASALSRVLTPGQSTFFQPCSTLLGIEGSPRFIPSGALRRAAPGRSSQGQPLLWRRPKPSPYCGFWLHYVLVLLLS